MKIICRKKFTVATVPGNFKGTLFPKNIWGIVVAYCLFTYLPQYHILAILYLMIQ
jgi:hypothetical protein